MNRIIPIALAALAASTLAPGSLSAQKQKRGVPPAVATDTAKSITRRAMIDTATIRRKLRYPDRQLRIGAWGQVSAAIDVTPAGKAKVIVITGSREGSGEPIDPFAQAVDRALNRKLKATPAMLNGVRVRDTVRLLFTFSLVKGEKGKMVGAIEITVDKGKPISVTVKKEEVEVAEEFIDPLIEMAPTEGPFPAFEKRAEVKVDETASYDQNDLARSLKYPEIARRNGIEGKVVIYALVGRTGKVVTTKIGPSDNDILSRSANDGVRAVRFTPAKRDGKAVATWVEIPVTFSLN